LAIERNREPLVRIVAALFAMIGLGEGGWEQSRVGSIPTARTSLGVQT
jgi:hypothetical protein